MIESIAEQMRNAIWADAMAKEEAIKAAMDLYDCGVGQLRMEVYPDGRWRVVRIKPEEFWLDWISDNHGWG